MNLDNVIANRVNKTVYRDGDRIYKVFDKEISKIDVLSEALNQSRVENVGLNVPKMLEVTTINGRWTIVSEFIRGKNLATLMEENPDKIDEYLEIMVDLQNKMHALTCPGLRKLKDKFNRKIDQTDLNASIKYELHTRLESTPKHKFICHGDFNPSNIIITDFGTPYLLDWNHATQGNASADIARTYLLFCLDGKEEIAQKYLKLICKKADIAIQYVQKWMPIVAASQLLKGKKEELELLHRWTDVVDFE